jgi:hypothetical protein
MSSNHEAGFRPSHFPALAECIRHEWKEPLDPSFLQRGNEFHSAIAAALREWMAGRIEAVPKTARKDIQDALTFGMSVISGYISQGWSIYAVEVEVLLLNADGSEITHGTVDCLLRRDRDLLALDWKTGDSREGYGLQVSGYAMAIWDRWTFARVVWTEVVYVDLEETRKDRLSYSALSNRVLGLYERWLNRDSAQPRINFHCETCQCRPECLAWRREADQALAQVKDIGSDETLVKTRIDQLKNDAPRLEQFVSYFERLRTLVSDWGLKEALLTHCQSGYRGEFYSLVTVHDRQDTKEVVDAEAFLVVASETIGTGLAATAITVDVARAKELWNSVSSDPFPVAIKNVSTSVPGYSYIRRKGQRGRGKAAALRKQRELSR